MVTIPRKRPEDWRPIPLPERRSLLSHCIAYTFEELGVSTSLFLIDSAWHPIHVVRNVANVEIELGRPRARWRYNERMLARARRERRAVPGEHAGFRDLFVPIDGPDGVRSILVIGPFLISPLTSASVERQWLDLSGTPARLTDSAFSGYLSLALDTLIVEGSRAQAMAELANHFAELLAERGDPLALAARVAELRERLVPARFPERAWAFAQRLLGERPRGGPLDHGDLAAFGLRRSPENVVVGYVTGARGERNPLDDLMRRARFQRAAVELAKERGRLVCGRVGRQGVVLLADTPRGGVRAHGWLRDLVVRAASLARELGLSFHAGLGLSASAGTLQNAYRVALRAAEKALIEQRDLVLGEALPEGSAQRLRELRAALARSAGDRPDVVAARFNQYVDAALTRAGQDVGSVRAQLDVGLEQLLEPLVEAGVLDRKSAQENYASVAENSLAAQSAVEVTAAYRRAIDELEALLEDPTGSRRQRGLNRAVAFLRDHLEAPLSLPQVARVAGFAPEHFSRVFRQRFGIPFARYRQRLRIEKAQVMLAETSLSVEQVQRLCGFRSRAYFHTAFKRQVQKTPAEYRTTEV